MGNICLGWFEADGPMAPSEDFVDQYDRKLAVLADRYDLGWGSSIDPKALVVVVMEESDIRLIIQHQLNKIGYSNVVGYSNGYLALRSLTRDLPQVEVVLAGTKDSTMSGLDLLSEWRNHVRLSSCPFVLMLGEPDEELVMLASESGVNHVLVQPFTIEALNKALPKAHSSYYTSGNADVFYDQVNQLIRLGQHSQAFEILDTLRHHEPDAARPLVELARLAVAQGNLNQALENLELAQVLNDRFVPAFSLYAEALMASQREDDALTALKQTIRLSPLNTYRYEKAAELLLVKQQYHEVIQLMDKASEHELDFSHKHFFYSQSYLALREYTEASRHIRLALYKDKKNTAFLNQLGICYRAQGQYDKAMQSYNRVLKIEPGNQTALYNKAVLFNSQGDTDKAIEVLVKLVEQYPDFAMAQQKLSQYRQSKAG